MNTIKLLKLLAEESHKASLSKLQFVQQEVKFLGHLISCQGKKLEHCRVEAIQKISNQETADVIFGYVFLL